MMCKNFTLMNLTCKHLIFTATCMSLAVSSMLISHEFTRVWGTGLYPDKFVMPARYFFIEARDPNNNRINSSLSDGLNTVIEGSTKEGRPCRIWVNTLDRKDGTYIIRYKVIDKCSDLRINILSKNEHIAKSPYKISGDVVPDQCECYNIILENLLKNWKCGSIPRQLVHDLESFQSIDWNILRGEVIENYDKPYSVSLCHYVIKNQKIYRNCYGKYVGFKMFMDSILLSLARKAILLDSEFFVNLGDWPLTQLNEKQNKKYPIFSWCGSTDSYDIVMPTYDITESTLENMGRVMLDMLSVQGNVKGTWEERLPKAFWRGRDSSRERLKLIEIARNHPDLFNCSLTNFFFFRDEEKLYGPKADHVSFYSFFDYKYQLGLDGTVAAYRFPYLLAGGSLVFKQESKYYEHFYQDLQPYIHFVPLKRNLEDLVEKIQWAIDNDSEAKRIAENGRLFANEYLLPKSIFCYYGHLLNEFSKRIVSDIEVLDGMEEVKQPQQNEQCDCDNDKIRNFRDEL